MVFEKDGDVVDGEMRKISVIEVELKIVEDFFWIVSVSDNFQKKLI